VADCETGVPANFRATASVPAQPQQRVDQWISVVSDILLFVFVAAMVVMVMTVVTVVYRVNSGKSLTTPTAPITSASLSP
jgi:hypothetical protein